MKTPPLEVTEQLLKLYKTTDFRECCIAGKRSILVKPDSIGYGSLGIYFFTLELYKRTLDTDLRDELIIYLNYMKEYVRQQKTNNYSLFKGRLGVALLNLQCYQVLKEEACLEEAVFITQYYWEQPGQLKFFDKNGYIDGIAGMLQFYVLLYAETKLKVIHDYIEKSILILISKATLLEGGIYWPSGPFDDNSLSVWPSGNAGVTFSLFATGEYFNNEELKLLATQAITVEENVSKKTFPDNVSRNLVGLYATTNNDRYNNILKQLATSLDTSKFDSLDLGNGMAGWGLVFKEAYTITKDVVYLDAANSLAKRLSDELSVTPVKTIQDLTFFKGLSGIGYALLKLTENSPVTTFLLPRVIKKDISISSSPNVSTLPLTITRPDINKLLIQSNFKNTYALLKKEHPNQLDNFLKTDLLSGFNSPFEWLIKIKHVKALDDSRETLIEIIGKELTYLQIKRNPNKYQGIDHTDFAERAEKISLLNDNELQSLTLSVSNQYYFIRREDRIDFSKPLTEELLQNVMTVYGDKSLYTYINRFNEIESYWLYIGRLYIDLFEKPTTVKDVITKMLQLVGLQEESSVIVLYNSFQTKDKDHLKELVSNNVLNSIKWLLMTGVLVSTDHS